MDEACDRRKILGEATLEFTERLIAARLLP